MVPPQATSRFPVTVSLCTLVLSWTSSVALPSAQLAGWVTLSGVLKRVTSEPDELTATSASCGCSVAIHGVAPGHESTSSNWCVVVWASRNSCSRVHSLVTLLPHTPLAAQRQQLTAAEPCPSIARPYDACRAVGTSLLLSACSSSRNHAASAADRHSRVQFVGSRSIASFAVVRSYMDIVVRGKKSKRSVNGTWSERSHFVLASRSTTSAGNSQSGLVPLSIPLAEMLVTVTPSAS